MLNAYFTVGAISAISEDCHDQRIQDCPCIIENARTEDDEGNIEFESCKADYTFATTFIDDFYVNPIDETQFEGKIDIHNIEVGKEVHLDARTRTHVHTRNLVHPIFEQPELFLVKRQTLLWSCSATVFPQQL